MSYQSVLPFDENYAWTNLIKQISKLPWSNKITYYGIKNRRITIRRISKEKYLVTSYSLSTLKTNIEYEGNLKFAEVEFMSSVLKPITKHTHIFQKSPTKHEDWKKQVYRCIDPGCPSYFQAQFIIGKNALCTKCHTPIVVEVAQLRSRNRNLVCIGCSKSPKKVVHLAARDFMTDLLNEVEEKEVSNEPYDSFLSNIRKEGES